MLKISVLDPYVFGPPGSAIQNRNLFVRLHTGSSIICVSGTRTYVLPRLLWIRIDLMRIRIQHIFPTSGSGYSSDSRVSIKKKLNKIYSFKTFLYF